MRTDVVAITTAPTRSVDNELLLEMVQWLRWKGLAVEIVALDIGTRQDIRQSLRTRRLNRWMNRRSSATLLIAHPLAATAIAPLAPERRVVAIANGPDWTEIELAPAGTQALAIVTDWICVESPQAPTMDLCSESSCHQLGLLQLAGPQAASFATASVAPLGAANPIVLLAPGIDLWNSIDHAIEVAWQLHERLPRVQIRWVSDGSKDRWLAHHDLSHAGLLEVVEQVSANDPAVLSGISALVRTGYDRSHHGMLLAATKAGIPVLGMGLVGLPTAVQAIQPFDIEGVVDQVFSLLATPMTPHENNGHPLEGFVQDYEERSADLLNRFIRR